MEDILNFFMQHQGLTLAVISGVGASILTFFLSVGFTLYQTKNFIKIYPTKDYYNLLKSMKDSGMVNDNHNFQFVLLSNMGTNAIFEISATFRILLISDDTEVDGWSIEMEIPILQGQNKVLIPMYKIGETQRGRYLASAEITYRTLANEKLRMEYRVKPRNKADSIYVEEIPYRLISYSRRFLCTYLRILHSKTNSPGVLTLYDSKK